MAITISQDAATVAIRAAAGTDSIPEAVSVTVGILMPAAGEMILNYAPNAPDSVHNAALVRLLGWLWDADPAVQVGTRQGIIASGAAALLSSWRGHRAGAIGELDAATPIEPDDGLPPAPANGDFILTLQNGILEWVRFPVP